MNCKAGDLAIIVRIPPHWHQVLHAQSMDVIRGLLGKIVTCVRLGGRNVLDDQCWVVDPPIDLPGGVKLDEIEDCVLKPIRGGLSLEDIKEMEAA